MKYLNFCLAFLLGTFSLSVFAQTPQQIESDLLRPFKNIFYYAEKNDQDKSGEANDQFAKKLKSYCEKVPATLSYPFSMLVKEHLDISTSTDGQLRIYSWDTWSGGTMHFFENVMQYKTGGTIDDGKLNDAKIIKTRSGLHDGLHCDYDLGSVVNVEYNKRPAPRFDEKTNTIYLPMIDGNYKMTNKFILYKFTGQYFERVKI